MMDKIGLHVTDVNFDGYRDVIILNTAIDPEKRCIYSAGGSGAAYWGGRIYKFKDGEFVVTNELDADWNGGHHADQWLE